MRLCRTEEGLEQHQNLVILGLKMIQNDGFEGVVHEVLQESFEFVVVQHREGVGGGQQHRYELWVGVHPLEQAVFEVVGILECDGLQHAVHSTIHQIVESLVEQDATQTLLVE